MHCESDGPQNLQFHYFHIEDIVRDLFADPMAKGKQHLYFRRDIGPDGKRRFTDAHTCLAFEPWHGKCDSHPGAGIGSLVFEVNMPLWRFGRGKSRSMSVQEAEQLRSARVTAARQQAASTKRKRTT